MQITDHVHALPVRRQFGPVERTFHLTLLLDGQLGPALVDTGLPGSENVIAEELSRLGLRLADLNAVIVTHHDLDHVGSLAAIVRASGARVLAHPAEAPFIDGRQRPLKALPREQLATLPAEVRAVMEQGAEPVHVDQVVQGGEQLDVSGGIRVLFTPGHTPGHISLYVERGQVLIAGDALTAVRGELKGPPPAQTLDMPLAMQSVRALAELDVAVLAAHHGGVLHGPGDQLRALSVASLEF